MKPANIMITPAGVVKILDFGIAKLIETTTGEDSTETMLTGEGVVLGTVAYMSPEQAEGKEIDGRSDIFSFGSVLYEMVTGRRAFEGDTKLSILSSILRIDPQPRYAQSRVTSRTRNRDNALPAQGSRRALSNHERRRRGAGGADS